MSYNLKDIVHETKKHFVLRVKTGFKVYRIGITHSTRCARIGYLGEKGKQFAIAECERREGV